MALLCSVRGCAYIDSTVVLCETDGVCALIALMCYVGRCACLDNTVVLCETERVCHDNTVVLCERVCVP